MPVKWIYFSSPFNNILGTSLILLLPDICRGSLSLIWISVILHTTWSTGTSD